MSYIDQIIPPVDVPPGECGSWKIERFVVGANPEDKFWQFMEGDRGVPDGEYTRLMRDRKVIMSDTPAEKSDHIEFVKKAKGHVLINGLGLGMCLNAVLRKPDVDRVTVIELFEDVTTLSGPHYATDPRVEIINCSAFSYQPPKGVRYGAVWHDIWDDLCTDNLVEMSRLHRKYGRRADWQGSWGRDILQYRKRRERGY